MLDRSAEQPREVLPHVPRGQRPKRPWPQGHKRLKRFSAATYGLFVLVLAAGLWYRLTRDVLPATATLYTPTGRDDHPYAASEAVAFTTDSKRIVAAIDEGIVRVHDAETGRRLHALEGLFGIVRQVEVSPDGRWIAARSMEEITSSVSMPERTRMVWDARTGQAIWTTGEEGPPASGPAGASPDLYADPSLVTKCVAFTPDSRLLIDLGSGSMIAVELPSRQIVRRWTLPAGYPRGRPQFARFSPDGRYLLVGRAEAFCVLSTAEPSGTPRLFRPATGSFSNVRFSPDGRRLIVGKADGYVWDDDAGPHSAFIWDVRSGKMLCELKGHRGNVADAAFSPDGRFAVTLGSDDTLRIWDAAGGEPRHVLHRDYIQLRTRTIRFLGERYVLLPGDAFNTYEDGVHVVEIESGLIAARTGPVREGIRGIAGSPDGRRIVTFGRNRRGTVFTQTSAFQPAGPLASPAFLAMMTLLVLMCISASEDRRRDKDAAYVRALPARIRAVARLICALAAVGFAFTYLLLLEAGNISILLLFFVQGVVWGCYPVTRGRVFWGLVLLYLTAAGMALLVGMVWVQVFGPDPMPAAIGADPLGMPMRLPSWLAVAVPMLAAAAAIWGITVLHSAAVWDLVRRADRIPVSTESRGGRPRVTVGPSHR